MFCELQNRNSKNTREINKLQKPTGTEVPFQDFLIFLFESASSATSTATSHSQLSPSSSPSQTQKGVQINNGHFTKIKNLDETIKINNLRICRSRSRNRRYSCPDFGADSELYSSRSSSSYSRSRSSIHEDDDNASHIEGGVDEADDDDLLFIPHSPNFKAVRLLSTVNNTENTSFVVPVPEQEQEAQSESEYESDPNKNTENSNENENDDNGYLTRTATSAGTGTTSRSRHLSSEHDLSFYKSVSASSRSRSSQTRNNNSQQRMLQHSYQYQYQHQYQQHPYHHQSQRIAVVSKRFTRSVPTKLNKLSRLRNMRLYYDGLAKVCPISPFQHNNDNGNGNGHVAQQIVSKRSENGCFVDPALKLDSDPEGTTMSLFLDAVHLDLESTTTVSSSHEIFYYY